MNATLRLPLLGAALLLAPYLDARAQVPAGAPPVFSIGQPPRRQPYVAGLVQRDGRADATGAMLVLGLQRPVLDPVMGLLAVAGELHAAGGGGAPTRGGGRLVARVPALAVGAGAEVGVAKGDGVRADLLLTWQSAIRRGGILGNGTLLRVDWLPTRARSLAAGVHVPLGQPLAGRTRRRDTDVELSGARGAPATTAALPREVADALAVAAEAARAIAAHSTLWSAASVRRVLATPSYDAVLAGYHGALARAFGLAAGDTTRGAAIAARARAGLLDAVLLPYDTLFGQAKEPGGSIRLLTDDAQARFDRWLADSGGVDVASRPAVLAAHARWLRAAEGVHRERLAEARDSRFVWLPLQLALAPEQVDEQEELDSLLGRAAGHPFTDGNALTYLHSRDLPLEIARSIYAARAYHVLWLHDFTGRREQTRTLDNLSFEMVADAYLPALTAAVRRYDSTAVMPAYLIVLDQYFYEPREGRIWMAILEDPLGASMRLPGRNAAREARLRARQRELREAVAGSRRLRAEAARAGGERWLRRVVKVHVNVTQPSDFAFRSHLLVPPLPFAPDNLMRDHRKLVLYDVNEAQPYRGALFLMGVGVGEHYASDTWEDRGYRLRGPAALEARAALRRLLRRNGFAEADIPAPLREVTDKARAEERSDRGDYVGRALQVHNEVGWGAKKSSVVRAMLYDLAPAGSVVVVPDPLWLGEEWAALLAGAASRGARVHVIAPAAANAPSPQGPVMALAHDALGRLLALRATLAEPLRRTGGELRVGLFTARARVDDPHGRAAEVRAGLRAAPWLGELFPFDSATLAVLDRAQARTATDGEDATDHARDERHRAPQLHQKTQLVARPGAIAALLRQPGWDDALARAMEVQSRQSARFAEQLGWETPAVDTVATRRTDALLRGFEQGIPEAERKRLSFYFTTGTHNADPRGLALDGEATLVTSGFQGATGFVDLYYLMTRSTWVETPAALARYLPRRSALMRRVARLIRPAL